jgi:integrase
MGGSIMATGRSVSEPFQRAGRKAWTVTVRWDGEGYQVALDTRDERKAKMLAAALRLKVESGEWEPPPVRKKNAAKTLRDFEREYVEAYISAAGTSRVEDRRRAWRSDGCQLAALLEWLEAPPRAIATLEAVTREVVLAFVDERRKRGSLETTRRVIRIAKAAWNWARARGHVAGENPWREVPLPRRRLADPRNLTDLELARLVARAATWRWPEVWAFGACGLYAGLRCGEIAQLEVTDLDAAAGLVRVRPFKHGGPRDTLYPPELQAILVGRTDAAEKRAALGASPRLFPEVAIADGADERAAEVWGRRVTSLLRASGVKDATLHDLRRTFAGILARRGVPVTRIRDYLGHESIATTEGYYVGRTEAVPADGALFGLGLGAISGAAAKKRRKSPPQSHAG